MATEGWVVELIVPDIAQLQLADPDHMQKALDLLNKRIKRRVQNTQRDAEGRILPGYYVRVYKPREVDRPKRKKGTPPAVTREGKTPPEIFNQLRPLGGVFLKASKASEKQKFPRAMEIKYPKQSKATREIKGRKRTRVQSLAGKLWGWRWASKQDYLEDTHKGVHVNHTFTGEMWRSQQTRVKVRRKGREILGVSRFKGTNMRGNAAAIWRKYQSKRRAPASARAFLANSRGAGGKLKGKPHVWFMASPTEAQELGKLFLEGVGTKWRDMPRQRLIIRSDGTFQRVRT